MKAYTEAHLRDKHYNEMIIRLPSPPPPYWRIALPVDIMTEMDMIDSVEYRLSEKRFDMDLCAWIAVYKQVF